MNILETMDRGKEILQQLLLSTEKNEIEDIFSKHNIFDYTEKISFLEKCMGIEDSYSAKGDDMTVQDKYEMELSIFIEGSWRLIA